MKTLGEILLLFCVTFFYSFSYFPVRADINVRYVNFTLHIFAKNDHSLLVLISAPHLANIHYSIVF